jgi:hypothetical protein
MSTSERSSPPYTGYHTYNSPWSKAALDKNVVPRSQASEFPRQFYKKEPFNISKCQPDRYFCNDYPIDKQIDYMFPTDRVTHPANFSRFGYPWCPNGYCIGNHPGRYNTPPSFQWQDAQPTDMALPEQYEGVFTDPNYCSSPAYKESFITRNSYL